VGRNTAPAVAVAALIALTPARSRERARGGGGGGGAAGGVVWGGGGAGGGVGGGGGRGHMAVQYAKAMGMHCAAVDIADEKLRLARTLGADLVVNAAAENAVESIQRECGGAHGVLVTAVSPKAFAQAMGMVRRKGTVALVGLPPGDFPLPIFATVLNRITVRGSIVGTRQDLAESIQFAADGKVKAHFSWEPMEAINSIFERMEKGLIDGRIVMRID